MRDTKQTAAINRRTMLQAAAGGAALTTLGSTATGSSPTTTLGLSSSMPDKKPNGLKQSIVHWCFESCAEKWTLEQSCQAAKKLNCESVELIAPEDWPTLKKHGLTCAIVPNGMPGAPFMKGFNNKAYHAEVVARTNKAIEQAAGAGYPNVIGFTGYRWKDADDPKSGEISLEEGARNCVESLKQVARVAEKHKVNVCVEHLNTRDDTHPMKGHPGYQGDDLDYVAEIIRKVGSANVRLLFDIYHVQVMNGDVIRRLEQCKDILGHVHTAGCPGRGELNENQEIFYPPIMNKLVDLGYQGFVGQEFIPTGKAFEGLQHAVNWCRNTIS